MKKRNRPIYNNIQFDSDGELEFYRWASLIGVSFTYQPPSIELLPVIKVAGKTLFRNLSYTPDFIINDPTDKLLKDTGWLLSNDNKVYIDVKGQSIKQTGTKIKFRFVQNPDSVKFSIIQKIAYNKTGIVINKVGTPELFYNTFCPSECKYTKTGRPRKWYSMFKSLEEYKKGYTK